MNVCCWDLEGPISVIDFAAEIGKLLGDKSKFNLKKYDMGAFFRMISNYDDYIIDVPGVKETLNIPDYQPGDTLRIMAPLYTACYTDKELIKLAKSDLGLLPGCRELINILRKDWEIFVISTSYSHFAHNVTASLGIPKDNVYCTELNIKNLKKGLNNIEEDVELLMNVIFQKYLNIFSHFGNKGRVEVPDLMHKGQYHIQLLSVILHGMNLYSIVLLPLEGNAKTRVQQGHEDK